MIGMCTWKGRLYVISSAFIINFYVSIESAITINEHGSVNHLYRMWNINLTSKFFLIQCAQAKTSPAESSRFITTARGGSARCKEIRGEKEDYLIYSCPRNAHRQKPKLWRIKVNCVLKLTSDLTIVDLRFASKIVRGSWQNTMEWSESLSCISPISCELRECGWSLIFSSLREDIYGGNLFYSELIMFLRNDVHQSYIAGTNGLCEIAETLNHKGVDMIISVYSQIRSYDESWQRRRTSIRIGNNESEQSTQRYSIPRYTR